jgi:hypothetical protein
VLLLIAVGLAISFHCKALGEPWRASKILKNVSQARQMRHSLANTVFVVNIDGFQRRFGRVHADYNNGHTLTRENVD